MLDTGIWPESKSFSDQGLITQVPEKWEGECEVGSEFNASRCNNKLIGARYFVKGYEAMLPTATTNSLEPTTLSKDMKPCTVLSTKRKIQISSRYRRSWNTYFLYCSRVRGALFEPSWFRHRETARGIATKARLAVYKVCWAVDCVNSDVLAGMEVAVSDGVDLLSLSLGLIRDVAYYDDPIAIEALGAIEKGVFVACSAGNSGPSAIFNTAPWITTVGASTIDRAFPAPIMLGNGKSYMGSSLNKGKILTNEQLPLVYGKTTSSKENANFCLDGSLDPNMVRGKNVLCDLGGNGRTEKGTGRATSRRCGDDFGQPT